MRKTKQKESSQNDPSPLVVILYLLTHQPEFPHKTTPADAGPANFDGPTLLFA